MGVKRDVRLIAVSADLSLGTRSMSSNVCSLAHIP